MLSVMTTDQKGAIAEAAIALAAMKLGVDVYRPLGEGGRCDLILDAGLRLLRVQCKWAALADEVLIVRCYTFRRTRTGWKKTTYSVDEVDVIGAYCMELDRCFLIPIECVHQAHDPAQNRADSEQPTPAHQLGGRLRLRG